MNRERIAAGLCSLVLLVPAAIASADTPLARVLAAGREEALEARIAGNRVDAREAERAEARAAFLPVLTATAAYARNQYEAVARIPDGTGAVREGVFVPFHQWDTTLRAEVRIFDLAAIRRLRAAVALRDAERLQREVEVLGVDRRVLRAYYDLMGASGLLGSARSAEDVARESLRTVEVRLVAGLASELDRERARAEVERAVQAVADAELSIRIARRELRTLTNLEVEVDAERLSAEIAPEAPLPTFLAGLERVATIRYADELARAAREQVAAARSGLAPVVTAHASERFTNAIGFGESPAWQVGITATVRLDAATAARVRAAAANAEQAALVADRARRDAADAIATAHDRVSAASARVLAARAQQEASRRAAAIARTRYDAGTASQLELLTAERDAFTADVARTQAEAELSFARALLRLEAGASLGEGP